METRLRIGKQLQTATTLGQVMVSGTAGEAQWTGVDPDGSHKVLVFDNTTNTVEWATISGGLSFDGSDLTSTATGSSFSDAVFEVYDNVDNTKKVNLQVSGVSTATTRTLTIPNASGTIALTSDIPTVNNGTLELSIGAAAATNNSVVVGVGTGFSANTASNLGYTLQIGPALTALASQMTGAGTGFLKKNGADTFTLDTATYLTSSTGVTTFAGGGTGLTPSGATSGAITLAGTLNVGNGGTGTTTGSITGTGALTFTAGGTNTNVNLVPNGTGTVDVASKRITNVATPTSGTDAVNKNYVDNLSSGLDAKYSVRAATTAAGTLATSFENGDTIDGVTLATGNRILIKNQAAPADNGIYVVNSSGAPTRAADMDHWDDVPGAYVWVEEGTTLADTGWLCTSNQGGVIGANAINWVQFSGSATFTASDGVTKVGNDFRLNINGLTADTAITKATDVVAIYDGANKKITWANVLTTLGLNTTSSAEFGDVSAAYFAIWDTGGDHKLLLDVDENLTANRTLNFIVNDANRTINLSTDLIFNGTGSAAGDIATFSTTNTIVKRTPTVRYITGITAAVNVSSSSAVTDEDGTQDNFTIPSDHKTKMIVYRNGLRQAFSGTQSRDYSVSGSTITFSVTPESWETFVIEVLI